jgi:hypothetical protein
VHRPLALALAVALAVACGSTTGADGSAMPDGSASSSSSSSGGSSGGSSSSGDAGSSDSSSGADAGDASAGGPPTLPILTNHAGGPVLTSPRIAYVFYPGYPYEADLQAFAQKMTASTFWPATTSEYGVGAITYAGTTDLVGQSAPATLRSTDLATWFTTELGKGTFGPPDAQTIYTIVYPSSTTLSQPNPILSVLPDIVSCVGFRGYHDNATLAGKSYAYAVIATCDTTASSVTRTLSHEWVEASTDPYVTANGLFTLQAGPQSAFFSVDANHIVWAAMARGGEAGDLCQPEEPSVYYAPTDIGYDVQRTWSNKSGAAGHDPCVPLLSGQPYFRSAPVLPEQVTIHSAITGTIVTQGITIPLGQTKTIDVVLYGDGAFSGPWTVTAEDLLYKDYGAISGGLIQNTLDFVWDKTQGVSGDTLHLDIKVTEKSIAGNAHGFVITSTSGSQVTAWPGIVVDGP